MSKCRDLDPLFAPYADGEAQPADRASVEAHLEGCPPCREASRSSERVRGAATHAATLRAGAPDMLRARCAAHCATARRPAAGPRPVCARGSALGSAVARRNAGPRGRRRVHPRPERQVEALAAQLTIDHVKCFQFAPERLKHTDATDSGATTGRASRAGRLRSRRARRPPSLRPSGRAPLLSMSSGRVAHVMLQVARPAAVGVRRAACRSHDGRDSRNSSRSSDTKPSMWSDARSHLRAARPGTTLGARVGCGLRASESRDCSAFAAVPRRSAARRQPSDDREKAAGKMRTGLQGSDEESLDCRYCRRQRARAADCPVDAASGARIEARRRSPSRRRTSPKGPRTSISRSRT